MHEVNPISPLARAMIRGEATEIGYRWPFGERVRWKVAGSGRSYGGCEPTMLRKLFLVVCTSGSSCLIT